MVDREHLLQRRAQLITALSELHGAIDIIDELLEYIETQDVAGPTPDESEEVSDGI